MKTVIKILSVVLLGLTLTFVYGCSNQPNYYRMMKKQSRERERERAELSQESRDSIDNVTRSIIREYFERYEQEQKEYWNSISREQALKKAGLKDAAKIERKARQNYIQGGGYTSSDGSRQIHYQGSKEQQEHLRKMDELGW